MDKIPWHLNWLVPKFPKEEGERRHKLIRDQMLYRGLDCLIIGGHSANFRGYELDTRYVSGFASWFDPNYIIFPLQGEPLIFTFMPAHGLLAEAIGFVKGGAYTVGRFGQDHVVSILGKIKELGLEKARIGLVSMRVISAWVYQGLLKGLPHAKLVDASDLIRQIRLVKSPVELEFMRQSGECADKGWLAMRDAAKPGVRELEIALACDYAIQYHGAESGPHVLIASGNWKYKSGPNYLSGGARTLKPGDVILNEITPCYSGYYTQLLRPICLSEPDEDLRQLFDIHLAMYELARNELKAGALYEDIEEKVRQLGLKLGKGRFADNMWTLETCDVSDTSLSKPRGELKPGMCFTIHPWTLDTGPREGSIGIVRGHTLGDSFIVKENGNECLSKLPHELTVIG